MGTTPEELRQLVRNTDQKDHGSLIRKALITLAIPAAVGLGCTPSLYAGPPVEDPSDVQQTEETSVEEETSQTVEEAPTESEESSEEL